MLEPGYEQPGHLLVFTDDRHIDRADVLMFQTPAIIPVVQIRRMRLAIGVHDEVGGELQCTGGALYQHREEQTHQKPEQHSTLHPANAPFCITLPHLTWRSAGAASPL